jgi:uncharacterized protein (TIGR00369 family)
MSRVVPPRDASLEPRVVSKDAATLRQEWLEAARVVREKLPPPGVLPLSSLKDCVGLEVFQRMLSGELPQALIWDTLDLVLVEAEKGRVVFQGHPGSAYLNSVGFVHGGWQAALLDSCMACAVQTEVATGQTFTTIEIKVNFMRALTDKAGPVRAEGRVIQVGRQIGIAEGKLYDAAGKLYAHGTTTCLIFDLDQTGRS